MMPQQIEAVTREVKAMGLELTIFIESLRIDFLKLMLIEEDIP